MKAHFIAVALALTTLAGCVQPGVTPVTGPQVTQAQRGTITGVRQVTVGGGQSDQIAGAVVGGLVGGVVGNQFGGGRGNDAMTALGALGGAAAGSRMASNANQQVVPEWIVRLDDGRSIAIVQNESFSINERVTVVREGNQYRMIR
jgi:outer membrane lipoprotein SlyB